MNIKDACLLPWRMNQKLMRWLALVLLGLAAIGTTALGIFSHKPDLWVRLALLIGMVQALLWPLCLNTSVLLTIDAHQLRLPGIQREAITGVAINLLVAALLPALVLGACVGHTLAIAVIIALLIVAGVLYGLLPRVVGMALYIAFLMLITGGSLRRYMMNADFLGWAWPALVIGVALVALCWRRLVLLSNPHPLSWHSPMMLRLGRGTSAAVGRPSSLQIHRRPDWLQARGDLRRCGPGHPVTSLRMALGDPYMPLTAMGRLRRHAVFVGATALVAGWIVFVSLQGAASHSFATVWRGERLVPLLLVGAAMIVAAALNHLTCLKGRWRRVNAELSLLAVLPQLGRDVKGDLLRAALWPPLRLLLLAAALVLATLPRVGLQLDMYALLLVVGTAGFVVVSGLRAMACCQSHRRESTVASILGLLLFLGTVIGGALSLDPEVARSDVNMLWMALLIGWLAVAVMLLRLGRRGWHAFKQRSHPFLAN